MNKEILHLKEAAKNVLGQIDEVLQSLADEEYNRQCSTLSNATIGQHTRHIIELFSELGKGYESGTVNYEKRKRDFQIENDKAVALRWMKQISASLFTENKELLLEAGFNSTEETICIKTNYYRELAYNIEHAIHHMALIRVGVNEFSAVEMGNSFGIAPATIKYQKACAQ